MQGHGFSRDKVYPRKDCRRWGRLTVGETLGGLKNRWLAVSEAEFSGLPYQMLKTRTKKLREAGMLE